MPDKIIVPVIVTKVAGEARWYAPTIGIDVTRSHNADAAYAFVKEASEQDDYERYEFDFG